MEALRDLADDFNARDPRKLRQRDLDVTQAMAFEALKATRRRRHGPARWASRPPRGRTTGCRPTSSTSARTRGGRRSTAKRAARKLTGDDGNFVVTTDLGNEFATLDRAACGSRAPHEAARGPQRHCRGGPGHPDAEEGPGHEGGAQGRAVERPL